LAGSTALSITPISGVSSFTEDYFNINIDQQISQNNKLSGKFLFSNEPKLDVHRERLLASTKNSHPALPGSSNGGQQ
jgi:hypothetical protein